MQTVYLDAALPARPGAGRGRCARAQRRRKQARAKRLDAARRLLVLGLCWAVLWGAFALYGRARRRFAVQLPVQAVL